MDESNGTVRNLDEHAALRTILDGTATGTGEQFFVSLVENLATALNTYGAWVAEYLEDTRRLRAIAFRMNNRWIQDYEYSIEGTACADVIDQVRMVHIPDRVLEIYPGDSDFRGAGACSYLGIPLLDVDKRILGHMAVMDTRPMPEDQRMLAIFRIFAARATAELQRLRAEKELREREQKLGRLVDSAMDAILELDDQLKVTQINPAAEKMFRCRGIQIIGQNFSRFLSQEGHSKLSNIVKQLDARPEGRQYLWIPGGLKAVCAEGLEFPAEATLSKSQTNRQVFYTLIVRDVNERLQAEQKIQSLTSEAEYLREELRALEGFDEIIGNSEALLNTLREIRQVAETDSTVLILGETGTGKELVARAIHAASRRRDKPLIKVNCAAIPATLMESEFFGHEPGAFTGATKKRDGRFMLANGGSIFLDEIGELPVDLQAKLLRVLQEGEFEPVGSSRSIKVDVRILTATNQDLRRAVQEGKFREDLYYRLNVFPVEIPPLRERQEDIPILASAFAKRFAKRMGKNIEALSESCIRRLRGYSWPGNVRELQNVIERAMITSHDGKLNLDRALPDDLDAPMEKHFTGDSDTNILTQSELEAMERKNIQKALEATGWKVSGKDGAASLLEMNPSTLTSRMKTLGIRRPQS